MMITYYQNWVTQFEYPWIECTSVLFGIFACKLVYDLSHLIGVVCFKHYSTLSRTKQIEWDNRVISTVHAIFSTALSVYLAFGSDLYADDPQRGAIIYRSSNLSTFVLGLYALLFIISCGLASVRKFQGRPSSSDRCTLYDFLIMCLTVLLGLHCFALITIWELGMSIYGIHMRIGECSQLYFSVICHLVSVGYFLSDLAMIFWFYPDLGGLEYVLHHLLSMSGLAYTMSTRLGQFYAYMVLVSETTTPGINLRWYLDAVGMKKSKAYVVNGVGIFLTWLVARVLLFMYVFYHIFAHYDQIKELPTLGYCIILIAPSVIGCLNIMWFTKITKGMIKTLTAKTD